MGEILSAEGGRMGTDGVEGRRKSEKRKGEGEEGEVEEGEGRRGKGEGGKRREL